MTNAEINEAVGKKLGWTEWILQPHQFTHMHRIASSGKCIDGCDKIIPPVLPPYSTSIEAAWKIVEFMKDEYFSVSKCLEQYEGHHWQAQVGSLSLITAKVTGFADTAPLAICKAFLKLK